MLITNYLIKLYQIFDEVHILVKIDDSRNRGERRSGSRTVLRSRGGDGQEGVGDRGR